eukprot:tig00000334_g24106.t1
MESTASTSWRDAVKRAHLTFYNSVMYAGWLVVAVKLGLLFVREGTAGLPKVHDALTPTIVLLQKGAILETVHSILGISRSPVMANVLQSYGRNFILFFCIDYVPGVAQANPYAVAALYFAWACIEIIRYPFYLLSDVGFCPSFLEWLRYTAFIPLYPLGAGAEAFILYKSLPAIQALQNAGGIWKLTLPNMANFAWDTVYYCWFHLVVAYAMAFPQMYLHMFSQRRRKLGAGRAGAAPAAPEKKTQ